MKHKGKSEAITIRHGSPTLKMENGKPVIMCPFCTPSHALVLSGASPCGTLIEVRATQAVYKARFHKDMVCVKCGESGGNMVQWNNAFMHAPDCKPGVLTFTDPPPISRMAEFVFTAPSWIKPWLEAMFGETRPVEEVTPDGTRTGAILGYIFYKKA